MNNSAESLNYDKFHGYLCELLQNYTKLGELLVKKLSAIARYDIAALDGIIKEEQVFVLLSRSFDSTIQSYREKLSLKGDSLSAIIEELPPEEQPRFSSMLARLRAKLAEVKQLNERCQSLIEERIYTIERTVLQTDKTGTVAYGKSGSTAPKPKGDPRILTKSV